MELVPIFITSLFILLRSDLFKCGSLPGKMSGSHLYERPIIIYANIRLKCNFTTYFSDLAVLGEYRYIVFGFLHV